MSLACTEVLHMMDDMQTSMTGDSPSHQTGIKGLLGLHLSI